MPIYMPPYDAVHLIIYTLKFKPHALVYLATFNVPQLSSCASMLYRQVNNFPPSTVESLYMALRPAFRSQFVDQPHPTD